LDTARGYVGCGAFGTFLSDVVTCTDNTAKMQLYYHQDGSLTLLQHCKLPCPLDGTRDNDAIVPS